MRAEWTYLFYSKVTTIDELFFDKAKPGISRLGSEACRAQGYDEAGTYVQFCIFKQESLTVLSLVEIKDQN